MQPLGTQEASLDPGCDATQNGMQGDGMQSPALYGGGVWTQHLIGNARQMEARILNTTSAWLILQFVLIL